MTSARRAPPDSACPRGGKTDPVGAPIPRRLYADVGTNWRVACDRDQSCTAVSTCSNNQQVLLSDAHKFGEKSQAT